MDLEEVTEKVILETCDVHSYTRPSDLPIISWMLSTDGVENCQEKDGWVLDGFHEVGKEGQTLTLE